MRLTEALKVLQKVPQEGESYHLFLACGFTPLHLQTFLAAHLQERLSGRKVVVETGLYGDVAGSLEAASGAHGVALALEWSDLDPRLGYRSSGSWNTEALKDILSSAQLTLERLRLAIERLPAGMAVAISSPTLPLPPLFPPAGWQASQQELSLEQAVLKFLSEVSARPGSSVVNARRLTQSSPAGERYDFKSDLLTGLPYSISHANAVGEALAQLLAPPAPKKGLITDLDNTLWSGIVGEVGPENVSWDLASHRQLHGLYQKLLSALAAEGVLVAVASKNDPAVAAQALAREDILIRADQMFPVAVSWNAKSGAVKKILETWNIAADSVVFIDDSPMELGEVAAEHPGMEVILFPTDDVAAGYALLGRLRDLFGKPRVSEEDTLRLESIRLGADFRDAQEGGASETFLEKSGALVTFDFDGVAADPRALELVNKTNQFNLNGLRVTEGDWRQRLAKPDAIAATISYQDRFGRLGKIAVLQGCKKGDNLNLETWVMSCRAFSRRIEHQCLKVLFERYCAAEIRLAFQPTAKNGPLTEFLTAIAGAPPEATVAISRRRFDEVCPPLYHQIVVRAAAN